MKHLLSYSLLLIFGLACGDDTAPVDAGGGSDAARNDARADTRRPRDAGPRRRDAGRDAGMDSNVPDAGNDAGPPECGTDQPSVADVQGTEGIAITADGTIYYSQERGVGRIQPGADPEPSWVTGLGRVIWGIGYRESDGVLFVASPTEGGGTIYTIDTGTDDAVAETFITGAGQPNGLIVLNDGDILFSDFGGGRVMRAGEDAEPREVTRVDGANGLLMDDDGTLLVLSYGTGVVWRITLDEAGVELSREMAADIDARIDGIGKDVMGRYYISDNGTGRLLRFNSAFRGQEEITRGIQSAANFAWGRGSLVCTELYVTSGQTMRVVDVGAHGRP